jgi:hypothetical protein
VYARQQHLEGQPSSTQSTLGSTLFFDVMCELSAHTLAILQRSLHVSPLWSPLLEELCMERLRFEGQPILQQQDQAKGMLRHRKQCLQVAAALPGILQEEKHLCTQLCAMRGELAVLVQHVYQMAAVHVQRVRRGYNARKQLPRLLWDCISHAVFGAAVTVQCL